MQLSSLLPPAPGQQGTSAALPVRLGAVGTELLGQWPVTVGERGYQVGAMVHLDLIGTWVDGHGSGVRGHALPCHCRSLQEAAAEHVTRLLHLDGDLLLLRRLRHAHARQRHVGGRRAVP